MMDSPQCHSCHRPIASGVHPYTMKIELYPRVEESLTISESDLELDHTAAMQELVAQMEAMSGAEVRREEERIYTCFKFVLCSACRDELAARMRSLPAVK